MSYFICVGKRYPKSQATKLEKECERTDNYACGDSHIRAEYTHLNYHIYAPRVRYKECFIPDRDPYADHTQDAAKSGQGKGKRSGKGKGSNDGILSIVVSSDEEYFETFSSYELEDFFTQATECIVEKVTRSSIISAIVHLDEDVPHLHVNIILPWAPFSLDRRTKEGKAKYAEIMDCLWEKIGKPWHMERPDREESLDSRTLKEFQAATMDFRMEEDLYEAHRERDEINDQYTRLLFGVIEKQHTRDRLDEEIKAMRQDRAELQKELGELQDKNAGIMMAMAQPDTIYTERQPKEKEGLLGRVFGGLLKRLHIELPQRVSKDDVISALKAENYELQERAERSEEENKGLLKTLQKERRTAERDKKLAQSAAKMQAIFPEVFSYMQEQAERVCSGQEKGLFWKLNEEETKIADMLGITPEEYVQMASPFGLPGGTGDRSMDKDGRNGRNASNGRDGKSVGAVATDGRNGKGTGREAVDTNGRSMDSAGTGSTGATGRNSRAAAGQNITLKSIADMYGAKPEELEKLLPPEDVKYLKDREAKEHDREMGW